MEVTFNNFDEFLQYHVKLRKQIEEQQEKIYELERELHSSQREVLDLKDKLEKATQTSE